MKKPTIAICYDFDMTLSPKNMQEFTFFEEMKTTADEFWSNQETFIKEHCADRMLANMYAMKKKSKENGIPYTKQKLMAYGKSVKLFPGVETWFERINEYGKSLGVQIEHYIISSGNKEIIEGTSIAKYFKKIYACSYIFDENGNAIWPAISVNYTNKTQFIFRVSKNILDETDDSINDHMSYDDRVVPFENIIYIGDSATDIPCMKLVRKNGGKSIGVYAKNDKKKKNILIELLGRNSVNYVAEADYSKGKMLEIIVKEIIKSDKINFNLKKLSKAQKLTYKIDNDDED